MIAIMLTLTSTAGLNTAAATPEAAAAVLGQHLHDLAPDGPIRWQIATGHHTVHRGHVDLGGLPAGDAISDAIEVVHRNLLEDRPEPAAIAAPPPQLGSSTP